MDKLDPLALTLGSIAYCQCDTVPAYRRARKQREFWEAYNTAYRAASLSKRGVVVGYLDLLVVLSDSDSEDNVASTAESHVSG